ncbi:NAD(P)/FAD-dependent oxidoreductase [Actinocorallia sp. A-T 12471]|uniref:flavin-containing monooxygenase n=1 Tax=Actinocorallia sp. A-T 12471 TaxID=3089813 RepID=UPI0029CDF29F|nr:NAD(P)/FAD-dependent oxidoreductase [Actinocorallia sp. A-T 12471]MDX6739516.1 NAD(P)/FAD-dependent oxidoreductase [Actinocorallia sp. A-T 12471]
MDPVDFAVVAVGAGFSGLCVGIKLREAGVEDFAILDAADGVGGVWRHNTYPGVAVDIPSATYSYSFEPNPGWSRAFAPGRELLAYAEHVADKYRLRSKLRLGVFVERADFDEAHDMWRLTTSAGEVTCRFLVGAVGPLDQPKTPDIPGIEDFAGKIVHTARWDHTHDVAGERVAVIGTGASGLQVIPHLAERAAHLDVYQRTPIWVFPKLDFAIPPVVRGMLRVVPGLQRLVRLVTTALTEAIFVLGVIHHRRMPFLSALIERVCRAHLRRQVRDPETRKKLTPSYGFGCKRPSFSNSYLAAYNRDDVELVTTPIERITATGIVTADGVERKIDTLVLATGFKILELGATPAFPVHGLDGIELGAFWDAHRYQNYEGVASPQTPNFWLMNGPYSVSGASWFTMIETGTRHIVRCVTEARRRGATRMTVKQGPHDAYTERMRAGIAGTIFARPVCAGSNSYYFDRHGDVPYIRAQSGPALWWASGHFDLDDYAFTTSGTARSARRG